MSFLNRHRIAMTALSTGVMVTLLCIAAIYGHYRHFLKSHLQELEVHARSHVEFLETIERRLSFHAVSASGEAHRGCDLALDFLKDYYPANRLDTTSEYYLARKSDDGIELVWANRSKAVQISDSTGELPIWVAPMRLAIGGNRGNVRVSSDGDNRVLYFRPIERSGWGFVAVVDHRGLSEPFALTGAAVGVAILITFLTGSVLFHRSIDPMLQAVAQSEEKWLLAI